MLIFLPRKHVETVFPVVAFHDTIRIAPYKHVETICLVTFVSFKVLDLHFISWVQFPPRFHIYKAITISHVGKHRRRMYCCGQCHSAFLRICPDKASELIHLRIRVRKHRVRSSHLQGCILCQIRCQFPKSNTQNWHTPHKDFPTGLRWLYHPGHCRSSEFPAGCWHGKNIFFRSQFFQHFRQQILFPHRHTTGSDHNIRCF